MNGYKRFWKPGAHQLSAFHKIKGGSNQFTERSLNMLRAVVCFGLEFRSLKTEMVLL